MIEFFLHNVKCAKEDPFFPTKTTIGAIWFVLTNWKFLKQLEQE